ncbi:hypothetical protein AC812_03460 [Bellilinea caldifistulae]|uniref:Spore protein YkvP/CgeB glycosyl transferase-like domain-containing protein n=1 Tax=Bellilinea caldifistulae TaxID=360411 RepID=A0A0P6XBE4_9CHLR|nr:hypothetical protein AC812_03460 [Bellilinea caldifistulae]
MILQRVSWDSFVEKIIKTAKQRKILVLADVDDLVFLPDSYRWIDSPDFSDSIRLRLYQQTLSRNRITLEHCDGVLTSTEFLAEQVRQIQKPVWVHRNGFSLEMAHFSDKARIGTKTIDKRIILGYASGTPTHDQDFAIIQPILRKLLKRHPTVRLHLAGYLNNQYDWDDTAEQVQRIPFVPWQKLPEVLSTFSINLAPLRLDNPFSQSKSEIKFIEAALLGVPTIASPTQAYQHAITSGLNGFLASSLEEWEEILENLINNAETRNVIGQSARNYVLENYSPTKRAVQIVAILNSCVQQLNPDIGFFSSNISEEVTKNPTRFFVPSNLEKHPTLFERGLYSIRVKGVLVLAQEMWVFFRRLLSPIFPFR